jgi:transcriptional regulator with XRE-family HTH domain
MKTRDVQAIRDGELEAAFYQELGRKLELRRKAQGLTQQALAAELGVHRNEIYRWEAGKSAMPLWMLMRVADVLSCKPNFLVPSQEYTWGLYRDYLRERDPGKNTVQNERDPALTKTEKLWA